MKVHELIALLQTYDPELPVILQKDAEGNGYSPLDGADDDVVYQPENDWSGTVHTMSAGHDEACLDLDEWEELLKAGKCVVLWPLN